MENAATCNRPRSTYSLCRRISPSTSLLPFAPFTRKLARSMTKREAPSCTGLRVRASATLHAVRKRVAGWSRFFFKYPCQHNSTRLPRGKSRASISGNADFLLIILHLPLLFHYPFLLCAHVGLIERLRGTVSGLSIVRTSHGASLAHLYHADVRHLTSFPTRSADLLDLSCSRRARWDTLLWNGVH